MKDRTPLITWALLLGAVALIAWMTVAGISEAFGEIVAALEITQ